MTILQRYILPLLFLFSFVTAASAQHKLEVYSADPAKGLIRVATDVADSISFPSVPDAPYDIAAVPSSGFHFARWSDGSYEPSRTINLTSDTALVASFAADAGEYCIFYKYQEYDRNGPGPVLPLFNLTGIDIEDCDNFGYNHRLLSATPRIGYHFIEWHFGNSVYTEKAPRVPLLDNDTATIIYGINAYVIRTFTNNPLYGQTYGDTTLYFGDNVRIGTRDIPEHCHFVSWTDSVQSIDGGKNFVPYVSADSVYQFALDENYGYIAKYPNNDKDTLRYYAVFAPDSVVLTVNADCDTCGFIRMQYEFDGTPYLTPDWTDADTTRYEWDDCPGKRDKFRNLVLYARPKYGYEFESWLKNGAVLTDNEADSVFAVSACEEDTVVYTAKFRPKKYPVLLQHEVWVDGAPYTMPDGAEPCSSDSVNIPDRPYWVPAPAEADSVQYMDTAFLRTVPDTDFYIFLGWKNELGKLVTDTALVVTKGDTLTAVYEPKKFSVTVLSADTALGHIEGDDLASWTVLDPRTDNRTKEFYYYTSINLTTTPAECFMLDSLKSGAAESPVLVSAPFPVEQDTLITATFKPKEWFITAVPNDPALGGVHAVYKGNVYTDGVIPDTLHCGDSFTLIPVPKDGCHFVEWDWDNSLPDTVIITIVDTTPQHFVGNFIPDLRLTLRAETDDGSLGGGSFVIDTISGAIYTDSDVNPWSWFVVENTELDITARAADCYEFRSWKETVSTDSLMAGVVITKDASFTAVFSKIKYQIDIVLLDTTLHDTISVETETIECDEPSKTLAKHSSDCYTFVRWQDDSAATLPEERVVSNPGCDTTFTALFAHKKPTVTVQSSDLDLGTVIIKETAATTAEQYCDSLLTLVATPTDPCYKFVNWSDGSTDSLHVITVGPEDSTYTATFDTIRYNLTVDVSPAAAGTVPALTGQYVCGSTVPAFSVTPLSPECFTFLGWSDGETLLDHPAVLMDADKTITAQFEQKKDTLTIKVNRAGAIHNVTPANGTVISETYSTILVEKNCGDVFDVTLDVDYPCFVFDGWDYNNDAVIDTPIDTTIHTVNYLGTLTSGNETVTIRAHKPKYHVQIIFDPEQGSPWWAPGKPGVTNNEWIECDIIQLQASPKGCYDFTHWQYGSNPANTGTEWNGIFIHSDTTFYAFYKQRTWNISFGPNDPQYGSVSAEYLGAPASSPLPTMYCDSSFTLTPVAFPGYRFLGWSDGSTDSVRHIVVGNSTPQTFTAFFGPYITFTVETRDNADNLGGGKILSVTTPNAGDVIYPMFSTPTQARYYCLENTVVQFSVDTVACYSFLGWDDAETSMAHSPVTLTADQTFTARFTPLNYTVTIAMHSLETGDVTEETESVVCGNDITLSHHGADCFVFDHWGDAPALPELRTLTGIRCDTILDAYYHQKQSTVTVKAFPPTGGTVQIQGFGTTGSFYCGEQITLVAEANSAKPCYEFKYWQEDGNTDNPRLLTVGSADATYTARFGPKEFQVTIDVIPAGIASAEPQGTFQCGLVITPIVTPDPSFPNFDCYEFAGWNDGNMSFTHPQVKLTEDDIHLTATFQIRQYTIIAVAEDPSMGSTTGSGNYDCGSTATISAVPSTADPTKHYRFLRWTDGNTDNPRTVAVDGNATYTAQFEQVYWVTVLTEPDPAGTSSTTGTGEYSLGENITVSVTPDPCYTFTGWKDIAQTAVSFPYTVVAHDTVFTALLSLDYYNITVSVDDPAHGSVTGGGHLPCGSDADLLVAPICGWKVVGWKENGIDLNTDANPLTVTVEADKTYQALLGVRLYHVLGAPNDPALGSVTGGGSGLVCGAVVSDLTAVPVDTALVSFVGWSDGETDLLHSPITVDDDYDLVANFLRRFTVTAQPDDPDRGSVTGSGKYNDGAIATLTASPATGFEFVGWSDGTTAEVYNLTVTSDTVLTAFFRRIPFTVYVVREDTVCGDTYVLHDPDNAASRTFALNAALTQLTDTFLFMQDGVSCKRVYDVTVARRQPLSLPAVTRRPQAFLRDTLHTAAATNAMLDAILQQAGSLTPDVQDNWWELYSTADGNWERYTLQRILTTDTLRLRFAVSTVCGIARSAEVRVAVVNATPGNNTACSDDALAVALADSLSFAVDVAAMHRLGYDFPADSVRWYRVVGEPDSVNSSVPDDEYLTSGYTLNVSRFRFADAAFYAVITPPEQDEVVACNGILRTQLFRRSLIDRTGWALQPSVVKAGEVFSVVGLNPDEQADIWIYSAAGQLMQMAHVLGERYIDFTASFPAGVYYIRIRTADQKETLRLLVKN